MFQFLKGLFSLPRQVVKEGLYSPEIKSAGGYQKPGLKRRRINQGLRGQGSTPTDPGGTPTTSGGE